MNSLQNTQPKVPTTPGTTIVTFAPGTQAMTLVSAGISNEENNQSSKTPMIHEIMASQKQPKEVNSSITRLPAGAGMCLDEMAEHPEHIDIIGASDDVQDGMK
eukprot:14978194-Ditylum_brightwellii.AAC.1